MPCLGKESSPHETRSGKKEEERTKTSEEEEEESLGAFLKTFQQKGKEESGDVPSSSICIEVLFFTAGRTPSFLSLFLLQLRKDQDGLLTKNEKEKEFCKRQRERERD